MSEILVTEMPFLCEVCCWGWDQNQHSIFCAAGDGRGGRGQEVHPSPSSGRDWGNKDPRLWARGQVYVKGRIHCLKTNVRSSP